MSFEDITHLAVDPTDPEDIRRLARFLHEEYEKAAADAGWETQEGTTVPFDELPEENRETMEALARRTARRFLVVALDEDLEALKDDADVGPDFTFPQDREGEEKADDVDDPGGRHG